MALGPGLRFGRRSENAGEQRESGWELHPVTKIEIWDDARGAYVEVRR